MELFNKLPWRHKNATPAKSKYDDLTAINNAIPANRLELAESIPTELGITMISGSLLRATSNAAKAMIAEREAENHANTTDVVRAAHAVLGDCRYDLGQGVIALHAAMGNQELATNLTLEKIKGLVEEAYSQPE